jgi:hypothetical protein
MYNSRSTAEPPNAPRGSLGASLRAFLRVLPSLTLICLWAFYDLFAHGWTRGLTIGVGMLTFLSLLSLWLRVVDPLLKACGTRLSKRVAESQVRSATEKRPQPSESIHFYEQPRAK